MKIFDLWIEGYSATGDSGKAQHLGTVEADSIQVAARIKHQELGGSSKWGEMRIDAQGHPRWWGCRVYDNERDARINYG